MNTNPAHTTFVYEARTETGERTTGSISAPDRAAAGETLGRRGLYVIAIRDGRARAPARARARATRAELSRQIWQLATLIEAGVPLGESLDGLVRQAPSPRVRALFDEVAAHVRDGGQLSDAMARRPASFPPSLIALVRASELSGTLGETLRRCSAYLDKDLAMARQMRSAMAYPCFMLLLCLGVTVFLLVAVLPEFASLFSHHGATLPLPTRVLMAISETLIADWPVWVLGAGAAGGGCVAFVRTEAGRRWRDHQMVSLPGVSAVFNALHQGRAFRTLAMLTDARVSLIEAVRIVREVVPNERYQELWRDVESQMEIGERLAAPMLDAPFIDPSVAQIIDNGDRAGRLSLAFSRAAEAMEQRYERTIEATMRFLEPAMILIMGGLVGLLAVSMMLPLFRAASVMGA